MKHALKRASRLALVAAAVTSLSLPAFADEEIIVSPYQVHRERGGEVYSLSAPVTTKGLNLRYDGDVAELQDRVNYTARQVCESLEDAVRRDLATSDRQCIREAVNNAQPQVRAVVARARSYASY
ncbi:MAG: UrcA family protein [Terricaulis sp.]